MLCLYRFATVFFYFSCLLLSFENVAQSINLQTLQHKRHRKYLQCLSEQITPANTVIAFDLHEVLFDRSKLRIAAKSLKLVYKGMWRYLFNYRFLKTVARLRRELVVEEAIVNELIKIYPELAEFKPNFFEIANDVTLVEPMFDIIKQLKEKGYRLYVLSNIGRETYEQLYTRYKHVFDYFDGVYSPGPDNKYCHKPNANFYDQFKDFVKSKGDGDKQILFIDDIDKNLVGAFGCNIAGIHCTSTRHVHNVLTRLSVV